MEGMLRVTMQKPMMKITKTVKMMRTMAVLEASSITSPNLAASSLEGGEVAAEPVRCAKQRSRRILTRLESNQVRISDIRTMEGEAGVAAVVAMIEAVVGVVEVVVATVVMET